MIREKGYVVPGIVTALMFFFDIQKGTDDIHMVYDGTASGLNNSLWCPLFLLLTIDSLLWCVEPGTFMCDNDIGEMFLNFMLHEDMWQLCGIDVGGFFPDKARAQGGQLIVRWLRNAMGLRPLPYTCVKFILIGHEVIMGDPSDPLNVFQWLVMRLNLPGHPSYNPSMPWVLKVRKDGVIATDLKTYVDDERPSRPTELEVWRAAQRASSIQGMLGIQDMAQKQ